MSTMNLHTEVLIVGGGMGGVYALHRLRQEGYQVKLVEAGSYFGGVWYWNKYPGARVDSEVPLYTLTIPEVWTTFNYKERFPSDKELRRYFKHCDEVLDLSKDAVFNTIIDGVEHVNGRWRCATSSGGVVICRFLLLCIGSSHKKHFPKFKGLHSFKGSLIHSAAFSDEDLDVTGKRVAVVGNGASGVQLVQELGKLNCQLTVFIRTPIFAVPMVQKVLTPEEQNVYRTFYPAIMDAAKRDHSGSPTYKPGKKFDDCSETERKAILDASWKMGGFSFLGSTFRELATRKEVNAYMYDYWKEKIRSKMTDPVKMEIVAPLKQQHYLGVKRPSLEIDYYEVIDRPNVHIVNLKETPIQEFTEQGIVADKPRDFDIIILATGYDSMTGSLMDINIKDVQGIPLQKKWENGIETHLGTMIPGMPNMFMVYSPQSPTALATGPAIIESQVEWIARALRKMKEEGIDTLDSEPEAAKAWRDAIQVANKHTFYPQESTWYMGDNIPGKVREQLVYIMGLPNYNKSTQAALDNWNGFILGRKLNGTIH